MTEPAKRRSNAGVKSLLAVVAMATVVAYFGRHFPVVEKGIDFSPFYAAARIVHDGRGVHLYERAVQEEYMARYSARIGPYFNHPPFEAYLYLPFCLLPPQAAYSLWNAFNAALLFLMTWLLPSHLGFRWNRYVALSLVFVPLLLNFLQGQDSIVLLFLLSAAFGAWHENQDFTAGCWLACGLIKFNLAIPIALVIVVAATRRFLSGFISVAVVLILISANVVGWNGLLTYPRFLGQLKNAPLAGVNYHGMANFRGLWSSLLPASPWLALCLTVVISVVVVGVVLRMAFVSDKVRRGDLVWVVAICSATLVSYHLSPHDLTILLLPMTLIGNHVLARNEIPKPMRVLLILVLGVILLPPLHVFLLAHHTYVPMSLATIALLGLTCVEMRRISPVQH